MGYGRPLVLFLVAVGPLPTVFRNIEDHPVGVLELALEIAVALVAEIEEKLAAIGLDALLRLREVVDLEAEMMRADEGRALLEIGRRAAGLPLKIEQREIDHAVAHVDRGTDVQILAADALEVEHVGVELRRLVEVFHADCKVAQTCHRILLAGVARPSPAIIAPAPWRGLPSIARCHRMAP